MNMQNILDIKKPQLLSDRSGVYLHVHCKCLIKLTTVINNTIKIFTLRKAKFIDANRLDNNNGFTN